MDLFPSNVKIISTPRIIDGGNSIGNFKNFNLALHVNDNFESVMENRLILKDYYGLPSEPIWLNQTHSSVCINTSRFNTLDYADASFTSNPGDVCAVLTADCLPVFVSNKDGSMVGIAHAGWRGIISGVIENLIESFKSNQEDLIVHLGPAISINSFEVGKEIKDLYLSKNKKFARSFTFQNCKYYLDLYDAAKVILESLNITLISGGDSCTFEESDLFFSYRS